MERIDSLPAGAKRTHLYSFGNVLAPRGRKRKESLSQRIAETLIAAYESWTDESYSDSQHPTTVAAELSRRAVEELYDALELLVLYRYKQGQLSIDRLRNRYFAPDILILLNDGKKVIYATFPCVIRYTPNGPGVDAWAAVNVDDPSDAIPFLLGPNDDTHRFVNPYTGEAFITIEDCLEDVRTDETISHGLVEVINPEGEK